MTVAALADLGATPLLVRRSELWSALGALDLREGRDAEALEAWRQAVSLLELAGAGGGGLWANVVLLELRRGAVDAALEAARALLAEPGAAPLVAVATARAALLIELTSVPDDVWRAALAAVPRPPYGRSGGLIEVVGAVAERLRAVGARSRAADLDALRTSLGVR